MLPPTGDHLVVVMTNRLGPGGQQGLRWRRLGRGGTPGGPQGDDVDVDTERTRFVDNPFHPGAAAGQLLPPAALTGTDHDLGDLIPPGEAGDGPGRVIVLQLVPAGADVRGQLLEPGDGLVVIGTGSRGRVAGGDVDDVEFSLEPGRHPGGSPEQPLGGGYRGGGH